MLIATGMFLLLGSLNWQSNEYISWEAIHVNTNPFISIWTYLDSSVGKESACNEGNLGSIPGLGRSPGEGKSYPLQYSGLENSMDCIVHGVAKSQIRLSHFHFCTYINEYVCMQACILCVYVISVYT